MKVEIFNTPKRKRKNDVTISVKNHKLGRIPNVSLTPIASCPAGLPCTQGNQCYALKSYVQYPAVKLAWDSNLAIYLDNPVQYFMDINNYCLARAKRDYFRWHVAGDIVDQRYLTGMKFVAMMNPDIRFMAFTKRYELDYSDLPPNLNIIISMWPGANCPNELWTGSIPVAWLEDKNVEDPRMYAKLDVVGSMQICSEDCRDCKSCWHNKPMQDVIFKVH